MRRILLVVGLVVLLAAAIVVPAVASPSPDGNNPFSRFLASALGPTLAVPLGQDQAQKLLNDWLGPFTLRPVNDTNSSANDNPSGFVVIPIDNSSSSTGDPDNPSVSQEFSERRIQSGSASPSSSFSNSGDNVNACPTNQQVVNTGNVANQQGVTQYNSTDGDIDVTGSSINIASDQTATCDQTLNQAAEAGE